LSEIICEKLKMTPGNASCISWESSSVIESLVTPRRQSLDGRSGANSSML